MSKYLRFTRGLALVSLAPLTLSCGARTLREDPPASADGGVEQTAGSCVQSFGDPAPVTCGEGSLCGWDYATNAPACTRGDVSAQMACGAIHCSYSWCTCRSAEESVCSCSGAIGGPLAPPDLPTT